jgi:DNA polymerase elongation subunit (family B)
VIDYSGRVLDEKWVRISLLPPISSFLFLTSSYATNADVVYGDTDSVMVNFGVETVREAIAIGLKVFRFVL